jgi:hypothetical protein
MFSSLDRVFEYRGYAIDSGLGLAFEDRPAVPIGMIEQEYAKNNGRDRTSRGNGADPIGR